MSERKSNTICAVIAMILNVSDISVADEYRAAVSSRQLLTFTCPNESRDNLALVCVCLYQGGGRVVQVGEALTRGRTG